MFLRRIISACCLVAATSVSASAATTGQFVNGGELYFLRTDSEFALWYHYLKHRIVFDINWPDGGYEKSRVPDYVPAPLQYAWPDKVSQGFGVTDTAFVDREGSQALSKTITAALNRADDYVWYFPERHDYLKGAPQEWTDAVRDGVAAARAKKAKLVLFGCFSKDGKSTNTPRFIAENAHSIERLPFDGVSVYLREDFQTSDQGLTRRLLSDRRISRNELRRALAPLARAKPSFEMFLEAELFLAPDVFDDSGWRVLIANARRMAAVLPEAGFKGILLDTENYAAEKGWLSYSGPNLKEAQQKAFERGQAFRRALGELTIINTVATIYPMTDGHPWGKNYELLGPFTAGMLDAAPQR